MPLYSFLQWYIEIQLSWYILLDRIHLYTSSHTHIIIYIIEYNITHNIRFDIMCIAIKHAYVMYYRQLLIILVIIYSEVYTVHCTYVTLYMYMLDPHLII